MSDWLFPDEPLHDPFEDEIHFNNTVREYILFAIVLLLLFLASHVVIIKFRRKETAQTDDDEASVDRIALLLCTFSLSVSLGAVLLLPMSILSNEVLTLYRDSLYVQWINLSLIQGMWNMIFLFSNISLFAGLPFAYLFTESEGFPGSKKGLRARIVETVVVLLLMGTLVFGVAFILIFLFGFYQEEGLSQIIDVWGSFYFPFLYSLISCLGVLVLLLCTPVGFAHLFTALGQLVVKPGFMRDRSEEYDVLLMEEDALTRRMELRARNGETLMTRMQSHQPSDGEQLEKQLQVVKKERKSLEGRRNVGLLRRTLAYPLALVLLLALTGTAVVIVGLNTLQLLVGIKALPLTSAPAILGERGKRVVFLRVLGPLGAVVEVGLILYVIAASLLGCYTLPGLSAIRPRARNTPMVHVIGNCAVVLLLSSALPLLVRTLGITNFDLLGDYGRIGWLGNFWIILSYNILFATVTIWCLVKKFTATIRHEIYMRFKLFATTLVERPTSAFHSGVMNGSLLNGTAMKEE